MDDDGDGKVDILNSVLEEYKKRNEELSKREAEVRERLAMLEGNSRENGRSKLKTRQPRIKSKKAEVPCHSRDVPPYRSTYSSNYGRKDGFNSPAKCPANRETNESSTNLISRELLELFYPARDKTTRKSKFSNKHNDKRHNSDSSNNSETLNVRSPTRNPPKHKTNPSFERAYATIDREDGRSTAPVMGSTKHSPVKTSSSWDFERKRYARASRDQHNNLDGFTKKEEGWKKGRDVDTLPRGVGSKRPLDESFLLPKGHKDTETKFIYSRFGADEIKLINNLPKTSSISNVDRRRQRTLKAPSNKNKLQLNQYPVLEKIVNEYNNLEMADPPVRDTEKNNFNHKRHRPTTFKRVSKGKDYNFDFNTEDRLMKNHLNERCFMSGAESLSEGNIQAETSSCNLRATSSFSFSSDHGTSHGLYKGRVRSSYPPTRPETPGLRDPTFGYIASCRHHQGVSPRQRFTREQVSGQFKEKEIGNLRPTSKENDFDEEYSNNFLRFLIKNCLPKLMFSSEPCDTNEWSNEKTRNVLSTLKEIEAVKKFLCDELEYREQIGVPFKIRRRDKQLLLKNVLYAKAINEGLGKGYTVRDVVAMFEKSNLGENLQERTLQAIRRANKFLGKERPDPVGIDAIEQAAKECIYKLNRISTGIANTQVLSRSNRRCEDCTSKGSKMCPHKILDRNLKKIDHPLDEDLRTLPAVNSPFRIEYLDNMLRNLEHPRGTHSPRMRTEVEQLNATGTNDIRLPSKHMGGHETSYGLMQASPTQVMNQSGSRYSNRERTVPDYVQYYLPKANSIPNKPECPIHSMCRNPVCDKCAGSAKKHAPQCLDRLLN